MLEILLFYWINGLLCDNEMDYRVYHFWDFIGLKCGIQWKCNKIASFFVDVI